MISSIFCLCHGFQTTFTQISATSDDGFPTSIACCSALLSVTLGHAPLAVHVIGDITGALGFLGSRLYARFKIVCNTQHWHVMQGVEEGYTQVDEASVSSVPNRRAASRHDAAHNA